MNHVQQLDRSGCALACAAMVKGNTYEQMKEWWKVVCGGDVSRLSAVGSGAGLRHFELCDLLATVGKSVPVVEGPAIIIIQKEHGLRHFVVVTAEGKILDPLNGDAHFL